MKRYIAMPCVLLAAAVAVAACKGSESAGPEGAWFHVACAANTSDVHGAAPMACGELSYCVDLGAELSPVEQEAARYQNQYRAITDRLCDSMCNDVRRAEPEFSDFTLPAGKTRLWVDSGSGLEASERAVFWTSERLDDAGAACRVGDIATNQ